MRTAGSLWLAMLSAKSCRCSNRLLKEIGLHPWENGWDLLWHNSVVYWIVPLIPVRTSLGPLVYVGETDDMQRRCNEHVVRLCAIHGVTQQPFFDFIRGQNTDPQTIKASICEWLFIPIMLVPHESRKCTERNVIQRVGTLNPPRIYSLLQKKKSFKTSGVRIFEQQRPLKRLRKQNVEDYSHITNHHLAQRSWKADLQQIAAAVCGHSFRGSNLCAAKAWKLEPGQWIYVVNRVQNCEEGWRRRRGLEVLRRISRTRRMLPPPISIIQCHIPWIGSSAGMHIVIACFKKLLGHWRKNGTWVPILRHARIRFHWSRTPTLAQALSTARGLSKLICHQLPLTCDCSQRVARDGRWTGVTIDGNFHIASPQQMIPWPRDLSHLAHHPASITLPPRRSHVLASMRESLRCLQTRCRIDPTDAYIEDITGTAGQELLRLLHESAQHFPIKWIDITRARQFLQGFFVQYFDHNTSSIGAFCPVLVQRFGQQLLDFGPHGKGLDFEWFTQFSEISAIDDMSSISGIPEHLQPTRLSSTRRATWKLGTVKLLPKWKAPGLKWRLVIDKHATPRNGIHSIVCRGIDAALDNYPRHFWSDCRSVQDVVTLSICYNDLLRQEFPEGISHWTESADMCDCFHHLPITEACGIWSDITEYWQAKGVNYITVPRKRGTGTARLGKYDIPGYVSLSFHQIGCILSEFQKTNLVKLDRHIGRELRGAPMGDSLSGAILRLFKFQRESKRNLDRMNHVDTCNKTVYLHGTKVVIFDISFRDDLRLFCAWSRSSELCPAVVQSWATEQLERRYLTGSMKLETSDDKVFVGLSTRWVENCLVLSPKFTDSYHDSHTIKPWNSWAPEAQRKAVISGLLCRAFYQCNIAFARKSAFINAFRILLDAAYPLHEISKQARKWAKSWQPPCLELCAPSNMTDIDHALATVGE